MAETTTGTPGTAIVQAQVIPVVEPTLVVTPVVEPVKKDNTVLWAAGVGVLILWLLARQKD